MMPIMMAKRGDKLVISDVRGSDGMRKRLGDLGFIPGSNVEIIQAQGGDMIVKIMESKLAITREMATKIMVEPR